ncbi:hypothetical protein FGG08_004809 [Glutinoglossum americanum]|uniref:Cation-transporting ATPase n=1 Tax=Glutinoglossum americanum TaxID=1670608 RepID=A0A9P8HVQ8_9PEZI|nr:hypothetical protein FGG08_004809 [Glutinoglossum americanum]
MAHDEVFAGPMSESVPTSVSSFAHRRSRADSVTSFTYFQGEEPTEWPDDEVVVDDSEEEVESPEPDIDLESGVRSQARRKSSAYSRSSVDDPLLARQDSARTDASGYGHAGRVSQKIYILTEDLTIVATGFATSTIGYTVYLVICFLTLGFGYLLFRWLPRWRIRLVGSPVPLRDCTWVAIEVSLLFGRNRSKTSAKAGQNQWGEMTIHDVKKQRYGQSLSTVFGSREKPLVRDYDEDEDPIITHLRSLDYRYIKFCYHPLKDKFVLNSNWKDPAWTDVRAMRVGIDGDEKENRELVFGKNLIDIQEKSVVQLLFDEAFHPFYVFQIASLILWSIDEYYYYAACIFLISVISITTTLIETRATMRRLREISRFECDVRVLRNGFWRHVSSSDLFPGDVYEVSDHSLTQFPCDSLLLSGDCIVNESMLTGESVPVSKIPVTDESLKLLNLAASSIHPSLAKHFLFCGTKIVRARRPQDDSDDEAVALAIVVRTGFNTTKGALVRSMLFPKPSGFKFYRDSFRYISVMAGIALCGFIASFINFIRLKLAWHLIIVRALDLITIIVPPALPATLSIGTNFALSRLRKKKIFCISPQRFSQLLEDARSILPGASYERDPTISYKPHKTVLHIMATCHSLRVVDGELVGDPLDLKMFEFTGWLFEEGEQKSGSAEDDDQNKLSPSVARPPAGLDYDMGEENRTGERPPIELGVLKSFEFVSQLRRASVVVRQFGAPGGDVFVKGAPECMKDICRTDSLQRMKRNEAESNLDFVGFIVFENKLKSTTAGIIDELSFAGIRKPMPPPAEGDASLPYDISNLRNYSVAVSGDVFRWVIDYASEEILRRMLVCGQVFARMSPDEKHELVEKLQSIDYCCGFCGDGANDCGALKAADVGISLSEAEASVAAPFTSRVFDISCVPQIIREGRAALVTSFSCFKYMSLYSAIQFTSVAFLYGSGSNLGDFQFLFIDLILILPIAIFIPFVVTIIVTLLFSTYMLFDPTTLLRKSMQLTAMPMDFKVFLFILALIGFGLSWTAEKYVLPRLARMIGKASERLRPKHHKKRKLYKILEEEMRT